VEKRGRKPRCGCPQDAQGEGEEEKKKGFDGFIILRGGKRRSFTSCRLGGKAEALHRPGGGGRKKREGRKSGCSMKLNDTTSGGARARLSFPDASSHEKKDIFL